MTGPGAAGCRARGLADDVRVGYVQVYREIFHATAVGDKPGTGCRQPRQAGIELVLLLAHGRVGIERSGRSVADYLRS